MDPDTYDTSIDVLNEKSVVSPTLAKLLSKISKNGLPDILIGNMVSKFVRKKYTPLLIDLAFMIRKKEIVKHLC